MLSDEAKAQIEAAKDRNRGSQWMAGQGELVDGRFGARTFGLMAEITPGLEVWTKEGGRRNSHAEALGGIVLHVDAGSPPTYDEETGEIVSHPARFRCYDSLAPWPHRAFQTFGEDELERSSITVPTSTQLVHAVRRFCSEVCEHTRRRYSGHFDAFEADVVTDAARLVAVLMGGR